MSSKSSSWLLVAGAIMTFGGLCFLPAVLADHKDASLLEMGACLFSTGTLFMALATYLKAAVLKVSLPAAEPVETTARRVRGGCDLCGTEVPAVLCRVHQVHLCGSCMTQHHDPRSCAYVPTTRATGSVKSGRSMAAKAK